MRKNKKKIIYSAIGVLAIAILSIMIIYNSGKRTNRDKMSEEEPIDKEQLEIEFNDLFTNEENQYVSTLYKIQEEKSGKYKIDAYIPRIHLDNKIDNEVNNEINSSFVNKILQVKGIQSCDALFAIGGGKCIDTVKCAGNILNIPVYTIPTIASTCAAVTKISIMYDLNGTFLEIVQLKNPPVHCFIEPNIIVRAPIKYLWAGIGDTMAKHIESTFSARNDELNFTSELGIKIGENCYYPILRDAKKALEDAKEYKLSQEVERTIQNIIVTTGCVSLIVNPEYNSALSHALFYGLTVRQHIEKGHLHGEVVSYGTLVQLMMDNQMELLKKTYRLHEEIGLPICLADLELRRNEDLSDILEKTVINQELRHVPYKVTEELILNAIMKLEDYRG